MELGNTGGQKWPARLYDSHFLAHLSHLSSSSRSAWLRHTVSWFSLHPGKLLLPTTPASPASTAPQHHIWQSLAGLQYLSCLRAWYWAALPREAASLTFWAALPGLASSAHINRKLLKSSSASEMAFVRNTAAFWLPSLWPEPQGRLQAASAWHHKIHLYPFPNFSLCFVCPYTYVRSKAISLHPQENYTELLKEGRITHTDSSYRIVFAGSHEEPQCAANTAVI